MLLVVVYVLREECRRERLFYWTCYCAMFLTLSRKCLKTFVVKRSEFVCTIEQLDEKVLYHDYCLIRVIGYILHRCRLLQQPSALATMPVRLMVLFSIGIWVVTTSVIIKSGFQKYIIHMKYQNKKTAAQCPRPSSYGQSKTLSSLHSPSPWYNRTGWLGSQNTTLPYYYLTTLATNSRTLCKVSATAAKRFHGLQNGVVFRDTQLA